MEYLVVDLTKKHKPFYTNWFEPENHLPEENPESLIVFRIYDGKQYDHKTGEWIPVEEDSL